MSTESKQEISASITEVDSSLLEEARDAMAAAMDDIRGHVQVADYNLNGIQLGEFVGKPTTPNLVHQKGIDESRQVLEKCRQVIVKLYRATGYLPPKAADEGTDNSPAGAGKAG